MSQIPPAVPPSMPPPGGAYQPPPPAAGAGGDRTLMLILSYLGILALIPLLVKKDDRDVQWHAKNGLAIFVGYIIVAIAWWIINYFMPASIGCALSFVGCAIWIAYLVIIIMAIMKALKGERLRVPGVSDFADRM